MKVSHHHPVKHGTSWRTSSQVQALDRTAPILPLRPGIPEKQTHDYVRHGLAAQSASIDTVSGASFTSEGYARSVQSALDAAHR